MNIIIYAQSLKTNTFGNLFYKGKYIDSNGNEEINLTDFFTRIEILNDIDKKDIFKVRSKHKNKYFYLYIPCEDKDESGRYSPIIVESYYDDIDKIMYSLEIFLKKSNRHISDEISREIIQTIENFKIYRKNLTLFIKIIGFVVIAILVITFLVALIK